MRIHIDKGGEVPIRLQLREQIIFLISTGELSIGDALPSVRELARLLNVHHNSVSHVYAELVHEGWLHKRPGTRLVVVQRKNITHREPSEAENLDVLVDRIVEIANDRGFSLQQLAQSLRERLLAETPDHFLIAAPDEELGALIKEELRQATGISAAVCSLGTLQSNPALAIGSIIVIPGYLLDGLDCLPTANRTAISISYSPAEPCLELIKRCTSPSIVGVISISPSFLRTASGLISPETAARHSFCTFLMESPETMKGKVPRIRRFGAQEPRTRPNVRSWSISKAITDSGLSSVTHDLWPVDAEPVTPSDLRMIDLLFCDSIANKLLEHPQRIHYRLLSDESLRKVSDSKTSLKARVANPNQ